MILDFLASLGAWAWIAVAAILLAAEIVVPGTFLLWIGAAAALTGVLFLIFPAPWQIQFVVFGLLTLVAVVGWFRFFKAKSDPASDEPTLNRRAETLLGREFTLEEPIAAGRGRVRLADTVWIITGEDAPSGRKVRVVAVDGATLVVEGA